MFGKETPKPTEWKGGNDPKKFEESFGLGDKPESKSVIGNQLSADEMADNAKRDAADARQEQAIESAMKSGDTARAEKLKAELAAQDNEPMAMGEDESDDVETAAEDQAAA